MDKKSRKLMLLGLDGSSWNVIDKLIDMGKMPTLARLKKESSWGSMYSGPLPTSGPCWSSVMTGMNPANHGILNMMDKFGNVLNSSNLRCLTYQELLSEEGYVPYTVNVPLNIPPRVENSLVIPHIYDANRSVYPESVTDEIGFDNYTISLSHPDSASSQIEDMEFILQGLKNNFKVIKKIFKKEWNIYLNLWMQTDAILHYGSHLLFDKADSREKEIICEVFSEVDNQIKWIVDESDDNTDFVILGDHGFTPSYQILNIKLFIVKNQHQLLD